MEKKKVAVLAVSIIAGLILIVTCILSLVTMANVKALQATLETINISYGTDSVVYEDGDEEPSILANSGLEFEGEDTISLKDKTIGCKASVTPAEFKKGTKAKIKVNNTGKVYPLKRSENAFEGTIRLPLMESADAEVILEDGENVRSEVLEGLDAYITTDIGWSAAGEQPHITKDCALFQWDIDENRFGGSSNEQFPEIQVVGRTGGKQVYKKNVQREYKEDEIWLYRWEGKVPLKGSEKVEIYVEAKAKAGLTYRYKIGQVQKGMADEFWEEGLLEVLAPDGTVLSKTDPYAEEEEDEI